MKYLNIEIQSVQYNTFTLVIYDVHGKVIHFEKLNNNKGLLKLSYDVS